MKLPPPPDRLTDKETSYVRPGNSPEVRAWNRQFSLMIDEYHTALEAQDEGWVSSNVVSEVRKSLSGLKRTDCHLAEATQRVLLHRRRGGGGRT